MFPAYLLADRGFWLFALLYVISVGIATALLILVSKRMFARPTLGRLPKGIVPLFSALLVYQFFHQAEHVTQMYQFQFLGFTSEEAHGFVWFLDEEWNHFFFNLGYMIGVSLVFNSLLKSITKTGASIGAGAAGVMTVFLAMESWHLVEHTYRIMQHVQGLCEVCSGIVDGNFNVNRLAYHFWLNFFALVLPLTVYVWYGIHRHLLSWFGAGQRRLLARKHSSP